MTDYLAPPISDDQRDRFEYVTASPPGLALMSGMLEGRPVALIVQITRCGADYIVSPLYVAVDDALAAKLGDATGQPAQVVPMTTQADERVWITLPGSGSRGYVDAGRYAYVTAAGFRVDIWARRLSEADAGAEAFGRAIDEKLRPIGTDGAAEADETISAGTVWVFGGPGHPETRHRIGYNVIVTDDEETRP